MTARGYECYLRVFNSKISEDCLKLFRRKDELFRTFFGYFPKCTEDFWRQPKISEEGPMIFRSYSNISKYFLRDYVTIAMVIILVTMAMPLSSHVKDIEITSWRARAYGIFTRVGEVSEIERVSAANEWDFWYKTNECENLVQSAFHAVICLFHTYWDFCYLSSFNWFSKIITKLLY